MGDDYGFQIEGMTCASCVARVEKALARAGGGTANLATGSVRVPAAAPAGDLAQALEKIGYPAREEQVVLDIEGMTCASCVARVERRLAALPGVLEARVNLADATARVRLLAGSQAPSALAAAVEAIGYQARPRVEGQPTASPAERLAAEAEVQRRRFLLAAILTLPVFVAEMGGHLFPAFHHWLHGIVGQQPLWRAEALLTLLVLAGPGRGFFRHGIPGLIRGAPDMNALVALGAGAAFLYSLVVTFLPSVVPPDARMVWFEAAAVIVTLILAGRWLEARAKGSAGAAIARLMALAPPVARVERDGAPVTVPLAEVRVGDLVHLSPGERVAVDGTVTRGESHVDESMLTGEPLPRRRAAGDHVAAGTLNTTGALVYRAERVGADTTLARIAQMVEQAQAARLPVQDMVNRVTAWFVPAIIAIAVVTVAVWLALAPAPALPQALVAGVGVLIVACPCAMGLAVPVSIMVATGRAADLGIVFARGEALQRLAEVRGVAFDKTGTLTIGRPRLTAILTAPGVEEAEALRLAAAAEAGSEHPLARAIVAAARERGLDIPPAEGFHAEVGRGVTATVEGAEIRVGSPRYMAEAGVEIAALAGAGALAQEGAGVFYLSRDRQALAAIALSDPPRAEAAPAVEALERLGLSIAMVSGDAQATAQAVGTRLGIARVTGGVLPEGKVQAVAALQAELGPVAFVGDGINDAPALAAADTGIAMGGGTDVAVGTADVVLMRDDPGAVAAAVGLSRATMANIRQNLIWAFGYNTLLVPVAAGVLWPVWGISLSPMLGAAAMALSSLCVLANALRLRRWRPG